tara:strand:- start:99 stop:650 length:552 start_codon:yes stop_codon:yes gene_type:complete
MKTDAHTAKVVGKNLSISTKHAVVISNAIRGKNLKKSKKFLEDVLEMKTAVPFTVHNKKIGHRKGKIASGRYPQNATKEILKLLNSVEANAQDKGLNTENLLIKTIVPNKASRPWHHGRQRRTKMKRTHLEINVIEKQKKSKKSKLKKSETKQKTPNVKEKTTKPEVTKQDQKQIEKKGENKQ